MKDYIEILKIMLKNNTNEYDDIIKILLFKIFDAYYSNRDKIEYNIDNLFKKYNMNMYNLLKEKYILTTSKNLIFKKHRYDKREYIMFLLKKNNINLKEEESYKSLVDEILNNNNIECYSKYINNYRSNHQK